MIHSSDRLLRAANEVDAPRMECGLKIVVSIPAEVMASLTHRRSVSLEAATCGTFSVRKSVVALPLMASVCWRYSFRTVTIHSLLSGA